jgi:two-component system chemotaxis sensor kinase CheA
LDTSQYLSMFMDESKEHLQAINANLLQLEDNPEDISLVQEVFRSAHTLKGMSASMGFEDIASLTHEMENVLDMVRNGQMRINGTIMDVIFESVDALERMVQSIEDGGDGKLDVSRIVKKLEEIVHGDQKSFTLDLPEDTSIGLDDYQLTVLKQSLNAGFTVYNIIVTIDKTCILKAARAYMVFNRLEENGEIIKTVPPTEDIEQEQFDESFTIFYVSEASFKEIEQSINSISEISSVTIKSLSLDELSPGASYITSAAEEIAATLTAPAPATQNEVSTNTKEPIRATTNAKKPAANKTIRVDIERLDTLMNLFSELIIDKGRLEQLSREIERNDLTETTEHLSRISGNMQDLMLKLRMVPIDQVFNRFPRMIRDLAKDLNKNVNLVITGSETELDRTVVDEIGDPLVHLLRNAVDHGLERPEERTKQGKSDTGTLSLRAFHSGNHVFIEIQDDGKGIDRTRILTKALERNIVTADQAEKMADQEVYQLLFASGFSTAETISDISGRGVGLDVVRSKIEALGGSVTVDSVMGKGTTFSVQLPLTLSIISAMLVVLAQERYAVPLSSVVETLNCKRSDIINVHGQTIIRLRDKLIPIIPIEQWFNIPMSNENVEGDIELMIIQKGSKWGAMIVDSFIGQQEIVIKPLGSYFGSIKGVSGATILGDGQVALIIDTNDLI